MTQHLFKRILHVGDNGPDVTALQTELRNVYHNPHLATDGAYGTATAAVVSKFQAHRHLGTDGIVDAVMWAAIFRQPLPSLHPHKVETSGDKLRRLREEIVVRQRQVTGSGTAKRMRAVRIRLQRVEAAVSHLVRPHPVGVRVIGNRALGGSSRARLRALALAAWALDEGGHRVRRYNQSGRWTVAYPVTGEPSGFRSDCSEWFTALYKQSGLPDPNGANFTGGYTGTLASHGTRISATEADWGDAVIWDPYGPQGHVAMHMGKGTGMCIGHGSPPIHQQPIENFSYKGAPIFVRYV